MDLVQEIVSTIFIIAGAIFIMIASLGILRLPDFYIRMSAITKAGTMGVGLIAVGIAVYFNNFDISTKAFVIISFMLLTAPVAAHIIARAAYKQGIPFWGQNLVDELDEIVKKRDSLEKLVQTQPGNVDARLDLISCYLTLPPIQGGSFKKAVLIASELKEINMAEGHKALGMIYTLDEEFNLAEDEYKSAVEVSGNQIDFRFELGRFYFNAKWYKQALEVFEEILNDTKNTIALFEIGKTAAISGLMLIRGGEALNEFIGSAADVENQTKIDSLYYMGLVHFKLKVTSKAKEYFEQVITLNPDHIDANYYLRRIK